MGWEDPPPGLVPVRPERGRRRRFRPLPAAPTKALLKQRFSLAQRFIFQAALLHDSVSGPQPGGLVLEIPAEEASGPWPDLPPSPAKARSPVPLPKRGRGIGILEPSNRNDVNILNH